jgi:hypothetical protein
VGEPEKVHPCTECFLINYVHPAHRDKQIPCHFIPLSREGETIYSLLRIGDVEKLEQLLLEWLDTTIEREQKFLGTAQSEQDTLGLGTSFHSHIFKTKTLG